MRLNSVHWLHRAEGHAFRASAGDSGRAGSESGGGAGTAEESPPAGRVTDETNYLPLADKPGRTHPILGQDPDTFNPIRIYPPAGGAIDSEPVIAQYGVVRYIG